MWPGSGLITMLNYASYAGAAEEMGAITTESSQNILTELAQNILIES